MAEEVRVQVGAQRAARGRGQDRGGGPVPDVLIIGAGASGAVVAWSLAQAGLRVVCLEQGDWVDPRTYAHGRPDWERRRQTDWAKDPNVRARPEDYPLDNRDTPITPLMFNAVGGSTIHWSGHFPRFRPSDFRVRSLDGVADDWPLSYWDLAPYYDQNDAFIGVSGLHGDPAYPPRPPRHGPPQGLGPAGEAYVRGLERLGWHWWPSDSALLSAPLKGGSGGAFGGPDGEARAVCNACGPCDLGCPTGAMSSAHVTYWPAALAAGAELRTGARVREITVDRRGRAGGAVYYDATGRVQEQAARLVVVACNGVGTPRLLLNSASGRFPQGLANSSGQVGRNLMFHPVAFVGGTFAERLDAFQGPLGTFLHCQEFYETDPRRGFLRGFQLQLCRDGGPLMTALGGFTQHQLPWGQGHHRALRERFAHTLNVCVMVEDLPEAHNRVTLSPDLTDDHGIPAPRVSYTVGENSRLALAYGIERAQELLEAAGAHSVRHDPLARETGWHLMGTARMGDDPATSVVDRWGRAHDVPNLFIVDGSVFVTCASINPTTTIQALALRTADWIRRHHQEVAP
jgi:choline dehydrogenase-like flavoprotein